jgi:hypothetical protein
MPKHKSGCASKLRLLAEPSIPYIFLKGKIRINFGDHFRMKWPYKTDLEDERDSTKLAWFLLG